MKKLGTQISRGTWNNLVDDYNIRHGVGVGGGGRSFPSNGVDIKVRNDTGQDLAAGLILELTDFELDEINPHALWFTGDTPNLTHEYGVLLDPIPDGDFGPCRIRGVCKATVNVLDANHKYAVPSSGSEKLVSSMTGPVRILYKPSGTGDKDCAVLLGSSVEVHLGMTDATHNKGSSGTVSRYTGNTSTEVDSTINDTVKNRFANVASGKWCIYLGVDGVFYMIAAEC